MIPYYVGSIHGSISDLDSVVSVAATRSESKDCRAIERASVVFTRRWVLGIIYGAGLEQLEKVPPFGCTLVLANTCSVFTGSAGLVRRYKAYAFHATVFKVHAP